MEKGKKKCISSEDEQDMSSDDGQHMCYDNEQYMSADDQTEHMQCSQFDATNVELEADETISPSSTRHGEFERTSTIPYVGMTFNSEEEAYNSYNEYGRKLGFSIKKFHLERRKDGSLKYRKFCYSKQGQKQPDKRQVAKRPLPDTRTNCTARVEFKIDKNNVWVLSKVELKHNHPLTSPNKVHMFRSHRKIAPHYRAIIDRMTDAGVKAHHVYNFLQSGASNNTVGFIRDDSINYIQRSRRKNLDGKETRGILKFLKDKLAKDPSFFYAIEAHESGEMANFFWADGRSIVDYAYFGDVVCFDTTFQTNEYDMPFAPIVGVNHHKQTIIFGAALLYDESAESFIWFFETFLQAMCGRHPVTIFTDQSAAIAKAIQVVLPRTAHRLCLWHIFQNAAIHLSHVIHHTPSFLKDFKHCVYERCSVDAFEKLWEELLSKYNIRDHPWMINFYKLREKWAACYWTETFSVDMTITQRSESMNCHFKRFFKKKLSLFEFLDQYEQALSFFREKELKADYKSRNSVPTLVFGNICRETAAVYTRVIYNEFLEQFTNHFDCVIELVGADSLTMSYKCTPPHHSRAEMVTFTPYSTTVSCTCRMFECKGILCMHALKVLTANSVLSIPKQYILKRWTKYAREGDGSIGFMPTIDESGKESLPSLYSRVWQNQYCITTKSLNSRAALQHIETATKQLSIEVDDILRNDDQTEKILGKDDDIIPDPNVTVRIPAVKKDPKEKRKMGALELVRKKAESKKSKELRVPNVTRPPTSDRPPMHGHTIGQVPMFNCPMNATPFFSYTGMMMGNSYYCSDEGSQMNPTQHQNKEGFDYSQPTNDN